MHLNNLNAPVLNVLKTWWWSDKGPKHVVLLSNKDKDKYFVVFDGFISILYINYQLDALIIIYS